MNDLTIEELEINEQVFFHTKPGDKTPTCITTVISTDTDERGREWVNLDGIGWVPVYHVHKLTEAQKEFYHREQTEILLQPQPGIDY